MDVAATLQHRGALIVQTVGWGRAPQSANNHCQENNVDDEEMRTFEELPKWKCEE